MTITNTKRFLKSGLGVGTVVAVVLLVGGGLVFAKLGGAFTSSSSGDINLQKGLVGWWKLDGNTNDSTPYSHNGTAVNAPTPTTDRKSQANSAYSFNGSNQYINVGSGVMPTGAYTKSAWIKIASTSASNNIISSNGGTCSGHAFYIPSGHLNAGNCGTWGSVADPASLTVGTWYFVAVTFDPAVSSGKMILYKNGAAVSSATSVATNTDTSVQIGAYGAANLFNGSIDDARIYNRALSPAEITALYSQYGSGIKSDSGENGLLGWWKMNGNVKDSTPYSSNGTITGTGSFTTDRKGQANDALNFTGTNYLYAKIGTGTYFGTNSALSVSAWAYVTSSSSGPIFGVSTVPASGTWNMPFLSLNGTTVYGWIYNLTQISKTVSANAWHHLVLTYDPTGAGTTTLYVDGTAAGTISGHYAPSGLTDYFTTDIGGTKPAGVNSFLINTPIEDVRAYSRTLSASDVSNLYNSYNSQLELGGSGTAGTVSLQKGLVGYWSLNGSAKDATPYSDNGTVSGATLTTDRKGRANGAYSFDGSSNYIQITPGSLTSFANTTFSISLWEKSSATGGFTTWSGADNCNGWGLSADGVFWLKGSGCSQDVYTPSTASQTLIKNNAWHHLVYVVTTNTTTAGAQSVQLYVDGKPESGSFSSPVTYASNSGSIYLGQRFAGNNWAGSLDEVRVYSRALNTSEIQALYNEYQ